MICCLGSAAGLAAFFTGLPIFIANQLADGGFPAMIIGSAFATIPPFFLTFGLLL